MNNVNSSLQDFNKVAQSMLEYSKIDKNDLKAESFLWEQFVKIFKSEIVYKIEEGKNFDFNELKNAMLQICQLYQQTNSNQRSYNLNLDSEVSSFDEAAYLVVNNANDINALSQALDINPTLSGAIIGQLITYSLSKEIKQNVEYSMDKLKTKVDSILNNLNINDIQKVLVLLKKITENEVGYIQNVDHNLVDNLNQLKNSDLRLMVLLNSLNLSVYSSQEPGIDEKEKLLYSGNNNLTPAQLGAVIDKNNEILAELYSVNEKYSIDGLKQYITNIDLGSMQFLCQLYVNSNSSPEKQMFMNQVDKSKSSVQIEQLKLQLKNPELHKQLQEETIGKNY